MYANQNNRYKFVLSTEEMKGFLGVLLFSDYHQLPTVLAHWSVDGELRVHCNKSK